MKWASRTGSDPGAAHVRLKQAIRRIARRFGFDIIGYPSRRRTLEEGFEQLRRAGVAPASVVDVGVGGGTPELYRVFSQARFLLVDPVVEFEPTIRKILERVQGEYAVAAAGRCSGTTRLRVSFDNPEWSTVLSSDGSSGSWIDREVPSVRLDDLVLDRGFRPPFLIKVDVQGAELEVLAGAELTLTQADAVVLEVSLFDFFGGAPELAEVVRFMSERAFVPYDLLGGHERPLDGALAQIDIVFVPEKGICRRSKQYAA